MKTIFLVDADADDEESFNDDDTADEVQWRTI